MTPKTRIFVYCEDSKIMENWQDIVKRGAVKSIGDLPWNKSEKEEKEIPSCSSQCNPITILTPTKIALNGDDGCRTVLEVPENSRVWTEFSKCRTAKPDVSIGKVGGQTVVFFEGTGGNTLELPLILAGNDFRGLVIGIQRRNEGAYGSLLANQRRNDGQFSAGYEIRG